MSHIILTNNTPTKALREQVEADGMTLADVDLTQAQMNDMFGSSALSDLLKGNATFTARNVIDQYGNTYDEIVIRVDGRFKRDGDLWLTGGMFTINMTGIMREIRAALTA